MLFATIAINIVCREALRQYDRLS